MKVFIKKEKYGYNRNFEGIYSTATIAGLADTMVYRVYLTEGNETKAWGFYKNYIDARRTLQGLRDGWATISNYSDLPFFGVI